MCGILLILVACWFWYSLLGNPLNEFSLIHRAQTISGALLETHESEQEDYRGHVYFSDVGVYAYRLPDGREFKTITKASTGNLKKQQQVEYLPDNPAVSRIKGDGCQTITEWLWRTVGLGIILLVVFISPGMILLRNGVRDIKRARRKHILFADDDERILNFTRRILQDLGYTVSVCSNGLEAVRYYRKHHQEIDLVLLGLIMPTMGGLDAFREMKRINPQVRVLGFSATSSTDFIQNFLNEGALGLVKKPFIVEEFSQTIAEYIAASTN